MKPFLWLILLALMLASLNLTLVWATPPINLGKPALATPRQAAQPTVPLAQQGPARAIPPSGELLLVFDASGSMNEAAQSDGEGPPLTKLAAAKRAVQAWLTELPPSALVGLRVYGGPAGNGFNACSASRTLVPVQPLNMGALAQRINSITASGATPITYSLEQAAQVDFSAGTHPKRLVLLTDGLETCDVSPCAIIQSLIAKHPSLHIDVIAFGAMDTEAAATLGCLTKATFGQLSSARTAAELLNRLKQSSSTHLDVQGQLLPSALPVPSPRLPRQAPKPVAPSAMEALRYR
jgi:hypothetical protein